MITYHDTITLYNLPLFTRVSLITPTTEVLSLPSEACYAYIVNGDGQSLSKPNDITAKPGQVILSLCGFTVGKMITEQGEGSIDSIVVHFNKEQLEHVFKGDKPKLWKELEKPVTQYVVQSAASTLIKFYFDGITQLFKNKAALTNHILALKLKEIILLLLQTENSESIRQIMYSLFSDRVFTFKETIDAYIQLPVSIDDLAQLTNYSLSSFKRKFKEIYKTTPGTYITNKRLEQVAERLQYSTDSISAIGYECGFNSPEHLSRIFKKKYGTPPSVYRLTFSVK